MNSYQAKDFCDFYIKEHEDFKLKCERRRIIEVDSGRKIQEKCAEYGPFTYEEARNNHVFGFILKIIVSFCVLGGIWFIFTKPGLGFIVTFITFSILLLWNEIKEYKADVERIKSNSKKEGIIFIG